MRLARRPVYVSCTSVSKRRLTVWSAIPHQERKPTLEPRTPSLRVGCSRGSAGCFRSTEPFLSLPVPHLSPGLKRGKGAKTVAKKRPPGGGPWSTAMRTEGESNRARPSHSAQVQARTGHAWLLLTSSATALVVLTGRPSAPRLTEPGRLHLVSEPSGFGFFLRQPRLASAKQPAEPLSKATHEIEFTRVWGGGSVPSDLCDSADYPRALRAHREARPARPPRRCFARCSESSSGSAARSTDTRCFGVRRLDWASALLPSWLRTRWDLPQGAPRARR